MKNRYQFLIFLLSMGMLILFSCSKKELESGYDPYTLENPQEIVVLLGSGFNDKAYVTSIKQEVSNAFIASELDKKNQEEKTTLEIARVPFIEFLVFPDDFGGEQLGRISSLTEMLEERKLDSLIIVGGPDGTIRPLAKIQDSNPNFSIISLFPQDNILGHIADTDVVFDFLQQENTSGNEPILEQQDIELDTDKITKTVIELMHFIQKKINLEVSGEPLKQQMASTLAALWQIDFYTDADTGLLSDNCFILSELDTEKIEK